MHLYKTFIFCISSAVFSIQCVMAQNDSTSIKHASISDSRPNEPIRIFSMRMPFQISPIANRQEISVDAHSGNTWNPSGVLEYAQPNEPPGDEYHPPYPQSPRRYQLYSADGVVRSTSVSYTRKVSASSEVYGAFNVNKLVGGNSILDFAVSDKSIEELHRVLFHQNDPFRRLENEVNRSEMKFTDRDGRLLEFKSRRFLPGTLDFGYRHFISFVQKEKVLWNMTITTQVGAPFNRAREFLSAGVLVGTAFTNQMSEKYGLTFALAYYAQYDQLARIRAEHFDFNYANTVTGYRFLLAQNIEFKKSQRLTLGIELQGMTAPLSRKTKVEAPYLNPEDIGIQTNYRPEYWTPDREIAITNQRRAARSLIRGSEYLSLNFSYRFGSPELAPTVMIYFQEDWTVVYDTDGDTLPLFNTSNNSQDFAVGIKWIQPIR